MTQLLALVALIQSQEQKVFGGRPVVVACQQSFKLVSKKDIQEASVTNGSKLKKLTSGNYGMYSSGAYIIVSKDCPVISNLRNRYLLSKRVITLASEDRFHYGLVETKGSKLNVEEASTLAQFSTDALDFDIDASQIASKSRLVFFFTTQTTLKYGSERFSYTHPLALKDEADANNFASVKILSSSLKELDATRRKQSLRDIAEGKYAVTETSGTGYTIKIFNGIRPRDSFARYAALVSKAVVELYEDLKEDYSKDILKTAGELRRQNPQVFGALDSQGLTEEEMSAARKYVEKSMTEEGHSQQEINMKIQNTSFQSKDLTISFLTGYHLIGQEPSKFSISIRIWP
jgi:hypothetical protein